ncbi:MAG: glycerophosphodiester phosphodiesterase [Acidimicrobiia bacterium]|nr:glycerophosphodiester phosphodiesterase [Acidimicrobiia bacterium]
MTHVIAHRGASAVEHENTLAAFRRAATMGADGVELDVRRTADSRSAVHHDAHLADGRAIVDVEAVHLPDHVPSLAEALDACRPLQVNIEIKNAANDPDFDEARRLAPLVVDAVAAASLTASVVVSSFDFGSIERVRAIDPGLRTAWLVVDRGDPARLIERTAAHGHAGIHPIARMVDAAFVELAHSAGLFVNVWTVDAPDEVRRLADLGVDGIVTNVPDRVRTIVVGR